MTLVYGVGTNIPDDFSTTANLTAYFIAQGETLHGTAAPAFSFTDGDGSSLIVRGTIDASFGIGVYTAPPTNGVQVRVGPTGLITSTDYGVQFLGNDNSLLNFGRIEATGSSGIAASMEGEGSQVVNYGVIFSPVTGKTIGVNLDGDPLNQVFHGVENHGRIFGNIGILSNSVFSTEISNTGTIYAGTYGIQITDGTQYARIYNDGIINGGAIGVSSNADESLFFNAVGATLRSRGLFYIPPPGDAPSRLTVALADPTPVAYQGGLGLDTVLNGGTIIGDVMLGGGDDTYFGFRFGSVDGKVYGGAGNDTLRGSWAADWLYGEDNDDNLIGNLGADRLFGGLGDDGLLGGGGNDISYGQEGNDILHSGLGNDLLFGGTGLDVLNGEGGNDKLWGGDDNDVLFGEDGADILRGENGDDDMFGGNGEDVLYGGEGGDYMEGGLLADIMYGEAGVDEIYGNGGNDTIYGGDDGDFLYGGFGADIVLGGSGNDLLEGNAGNDILNGQLGNDTIFGDAGFDRLRGGLGADVFAFADWDNNVGVNRILDFQDGIDLIDVNGWGVENLDAFLDRAMTRNGADAIINLDLADLDPTSPLSGTIVVVGGWGQITADDFVPLI